MASSSLYGPPNYFHYDVFPSFYGPDVRWSFLTRILKEFRSKHDRLDSFANDRNTRRRSILHELKDGIRESRIAIVILSRNYASSTWCLDELVEIMNSKEELGQVVIPIFYELDPTDVKKQTGDFGNFFRETCSDKTEDVERWRQALSEVATIAGYRIYHSTTNPRDIQKAQAIIEEITTHISNTLENSIQSSDFKGLVGMRVHMEKMEPMLSLDLDEPRMIGIWGPSGIGKSTIARFLFNQFSHHFQLSVFMEDIKRRYQRPSDYDDEYIAKLLLQRDFLSQILNHKDNLIPHLGAVQEKLNNIKVLVVLDDVDSLGQLDALAKEIRWFGPGSRIIITTQDWTLLKAHGINHIYKVGFPPPDKALQIFCMYAFGQKSPRDGFEYLAREVTELAGGIPLGLRLMGSYLRGMSKKQWENELQRLRINPDRKIGSIIKFIYGSVGDDEKERWRSQISDSHSAELAERIEEYHAKVFSEVRQEHLVTNQDIKKVFYTSERAFKDTIYIYCEDRLQYSFASHLSFNFRRKGIDACVNCNETLDVLERLSASVVILSKSCFSSTSCLDKLVRILQCQRNTGQLVIPVLYGINQSDVEVQEQESTDWVREWRSALQELRELPGHHSREECSEQELVEEIVKDVYEKLFPAQQIGINLRLQEVEQFLCKQPWGIRRIGIWGMPGIGKTTLAKAYFDQIAGGYEASCFIKHFDKAFHEKGLQPLLDEHFGEILKKLPGLCSSITRPSLPRDKINKKRTLVVLDDVHNPLVAESFLGGFHWFGPGSLIIITSRIKQVFRHCQINHVYEVQSLSESEALQLFSQCEFGDDIRNQKLRVLSMEVIDYANGNPFALSFYKKELKGKKLSEMETTFLKLKLHAPYKIHDLFKSSYVTLTDEEKNIFLDIACFFMGEDVDYVMLLFDGCGFFPHVGIDVLAEKCLVTISEKRVKMHRIIQDFGREIINRETVLIERRRRLWEPWTIKFLLEDDKLKAKRDHKAKYTRALGTEDVEGIYLDTLNLVFDVKPTAFKNMLNLRFLKIYCSDYENHYGLCLPNGLQSLPYKLRLLHWENYPLQSLPQDFDPSHLVVLNMSYSQLHKLWTGSKNLDMLKMVRLCHSQQLTEIDNICEAHKIELIDLKGCTKLKSFPAVGQLQHLRVVNLSGCTEIRSFGEVSPNIEELRLQGTGITKLTSIGNATNLKKLYLTGCSSLLELPASIGNATNLKILDLGDCSSLIKLPPSIGNAINLQVLNLRYCSKLMELPFSVGTAINLQKLNLEYCWSMIDLPSSIGNATNLQELNLGYCSKLVKLPSSLGNAKNLQKLNLTGCSCLVELPTSIGNATNLKILDLSFCSSLVKLPSSIGNATNLHELNLEYCSKLVKLPSSIGNATNLKKLDLNGCSSLVELPSSIGNAANLQELNLIYCSKLVELPSSIGNATNLKILRLNGCSSLVKLPSSIGNATNLQELNLGYCSELVELPSSIGNATNLKKLDLDSCSSLVELPSSIGNATNLQELNLGYCSKLVELPSSIGNATNLKILRLNGCSSLVKLPSSIGNATNLQDLNLGYCSELVELPSSIGNATNLKKLDLDSCSSLVELPSSIGNATNLQELYLGYCSKLVELPSSIGNATNLKKLDLDSCSSLVELPSSIGNATNLQELYLGYCSKLVELPSSIGNATNLKKLDLIRCLSLVKLPSSIGNATNLQELNLEYCSKLVKLPSSIGNATNLKKLDLNECLSLVKLPSSIGNTTNLQELNLGNCSKLVELPSSIGNATNLKILRLNGCSSLVKLPSSIGNATNLQDLNLGYCSELVELPSSIGNATNLKKLDLDSCSSLVELPSSIGNATNLQELYLGYCSKLVELPSSIGNATNLKKLDLDSCSSLVELPSSIGNATNLQELYLGYCSKLVELPSSIGNATNLKKLDLIRCLSLVKLPSSIGNATNLQELNLEYCSKLVKLPSSIGNATNLKKLDLNSCSSLMKLPSSIGNATNLQELNLGYCSKLVELPSSIGNATNLKKLDLIRCSSLMELPSSIGNAINLQELNLDYCTSLVKLPSSFSNTTTLKKLSLYGCSSLVELPFSIRNSTSLVSIHFSEKNNLAIVTFNYNSGSRCTEVNCAKRGNFFVLKGEQNVENYVSNVSLVFRIVDENGRVRNVDFLFDQEGDTAIKVSSVFVKRLELNEENITFIAEMIDILLEKMIGPRDKRRPNHLMHWQLNQNEDRTQRQEETAFHDTSDSVRDSSTSNFPQSDDKEKHRVDAIKVEDRKSNQEEEEATEPVSLEEEERLRQELEEIEAKYREEMKDLARKREEAIMDTQKKLSLMTKRKNKLSSQKAQQESFGIYRETMRVSEKVADEFNEATHRDPAGSEIKTKLEK